MTRAKTRALGLAAFFVSLVARVPLAGAWGEDGHRVVATIAAHRLKPNAAAAVAEILKHDKTGKTLADVAIWADTIRNNNTKGEQKMPETANWHFVDIPVDENQNTYDPARDCKSTPAGDCVVNALDRETKKLTLPNATELERAHALKFIVHFVGDIHEPLHCAERNSDRGGNDVKLTFFGAAMEPPPFDKKNWNLHAVWDFGLIENKGLSQATYVKQLEAALASADIAAMESGTFADWANESHAEAVAHSYRSADGTKAFPTKNGQVGPKYFKANIGVVDEQLAKAGVRLAKVLNETFP